MATAGIEGEKLDLEAVRSSVMRKTGFGKPGASPRHVDGLVDVMDDAARNFGGKLTHARLCNWQAALFPTFSVRLPATKFPDCLRQLCG